MTNDRVNETRNTQAVDQITDKPRATNHGARSDSGTSVGKRELKQPEGEKRHACGFVRCRCILEEEPVVSDQSIAVTEHEREAPCIKEDSAEACVDNTFHQDVNRLARSAKSGLKHRETDLHTEDEKCGDEGPHCVDRVHNVVARERGIRSKRSKPEQPRVDKHDAHDEQAEAHQLSA